MALFKSLEDKEKERRYRDSLQRLIIFPGSVPEYEAFRGYKVGKEDVIAQYEPFQSESVLRYENEIEPLDYKYVPLPKKHWWSKQKYDVKVIPSRPATFGEIEFLAAQLHEQKW